MAAPPRIRAIGREAIPGAPAWFDSFLQLYNEQSGASGTALAKRLTFTDNFLAVLKDIDFTAPYPVWTAPRFTNGWVNFAGGTQAQVGYRIDNRGEVWLRGLTSTGTVSTGSTGNIFPLPVGYRPPLDEIFAVASNSLFGECRVFSDGGVRAYNGSSGWFSLAGIHFAATTPALPTIEGEVLPPVKHGLPAVAGVLPVLVRAASGGPLLSAGGLSLDWEPASRDAIRIKAVWGLTPGQRYRVRLLIFAG